MMTMKCDDDGEGDDDGDDDDDDVNDELCSFSNDTQTFLSPTISNICWIAIDMIPTATAG